VILADTSIWIDHFRHSDAELRRVIEEDMLLSHPFVIGELALGSLRERTAVLAFLAAQRQAAVAAHDEIMTMIEHHRLFSMGVGYTDAHLLASVLLERGAALWTRDKGLQAAAAKAGAALHAPTAAS
jgi:hypothetical protein